MGALVYRALCEIAVRMAFWCVGVPVAALFAAYLAGIAALCAGELRAHPKKRPNREEAP